MDEPKTENTTETKPTETKPEPKVDKKPKVAARMTMEELTKEYPNQKIVAGSLGFLDSEQKQVVKIVCTTAGCGKERLVRTSDLWQVQHCEACTRKERRGRARERRKERKAEAKAETKVVETVATAS